MRSNSWQKCVLAATLMISLITTGCSAQWISVALADLPVLTQMALNIASLAAVLQSGQQLDPAEAAGIQNIATEASRDLNLLQTLYGQYKATPDAATLQKIQGAIAAVNQNLPALLQTAHVSNPALAARVTAAVNLIVVTVNSFSALIPHSAAARFAQKVKVPNAQELKRQWNHQVCGPTGNAALDAAFVECRMR